MSALSHCALLTTSHLSKCILTYCINQIHTIKKIEQKWFSVLCKWFRWYCAYQLLSFSQAIQFYIHQIFFTKLYINMGNVISVWRLSLQHEPSFDLLKEKDQVFSYQYFTKEIIKMSLRSLLFYFVHPFQFNSPSDFYV